MKAAIIARYGSPDVIAIRDVPKPKPARGEVLIRVHATAVGRTDCGELRAHPVFMRIFTGLFRPRRQILGLEFAGEVEAVGRGVTAVKPGARVFGMCPSRSNGAQAEYVCVPERTVAAMPQGLRFDEAVVCEGAFYANAVLKRIGLVRGQAILIYGASGAIGTALVQLAKSAGAAVTAVVATRHLDLVKSLGADRAIDYTAGDFTRLGERFDFVVDAVGKTSFFRCRKLLKPGGIFAATDLGAGGQNIWLALMVVAHGQQPRRHSDARAHRRFHARPENPHRGRRTSRDRRPQIPPRANRRRLPLCRDRTEDGHRRDRGRGAGIVRIPAFFCSHFVLDKRRRLI